MDRTLLARARDFSFSSENTYRSAKHRRANLKWAVMFLKKDMTNPKVSRGASISSTDRNMAYRRPSAAFWQR